METEMTKLYSVLTEEDLRARMEKDAEYLSGILSVSKSDATILLVHHGWSLSRVFDAWVKDEKKFWEESGLKPVSDLSSPVNDCDSTCGICFESNPKKSGILISTPFCSHNFCKTCWGEYIRNSEPNPDITCPSPDCRAAVGLDTIQRLSRTVRIKYRKYLFWSYMEHKKEIKWCPAPECQNAIELLNPEDAADCSDVVCLCSHTFCWRCLLESHRPVTCNNALEWFKSGATDLSLSLNWIAIYTKPCPSCYRPIERDNEDKYCKIMTCAEPCLFRFCWNCLCETEGERHDFFCKEAFMPPGIPPEGYELKDLTISSYEYQRHSHCLEHWEVNHQAMQKAVSYLGDIENSLMDILCEKYGVSKNDLGFVKEACMLIVQCRQVLKWSYVYDYFLSEYENAKKQYLKHLQNEAVTTAQNYSMKLEEEMLRAVDGWSVQDFSYFRKKLTNMTSVTGNYFHQFLKTLEGGLWEVTVASYGDAAGAYWFCDRCTYGNHWLDKECQICHDASTIF